jgi:peptide/nickel transport system permease protein
VDGGHHPGERVQLARAVQQFEIGVVVGETAIYAYLLAITILGLDIVYAIVDPRVKVVGSQGIG